MRSLEVAILQCAVYVITKADANQTKLQNLQGTPRQSAKWQTASPQPGPSSRETNRVRCVTGRRRTGHSHMTRVHDRPLPLPARARMSERKIFPPEQRGQCRAFLPSQLPTVIPQHPTAIAEMLLQGVLCSLPPRQCAFLCSIPTTGSECSTWAQPTATILSTVWTAGKELLNSVRAAGSCPYPSISAVPPFGRGE